MEGKVFDRLTVVSLSYTGANYNKYWNCTCDCGNVTTVRGDRLTRSVTRSCGCLRRENKGNIQSALDARAAKIINYGNRAYIRDSYRSMIRRCYEPKHPGYHKYGAKGITVCDRWRLGEVGKSGLDCFCEDMGIRLRGLTIDRIDNSKGYYPENCQWATVQEQAANKTKKVML